MNELERTLYDLVVPIVEHPDAVSVKTMPSLNNNEIVLYVVANNEDVARLIGRQGSMASALRQMMLVASRIQDKRITIKFEAY